MTAGRKVAVRVQFFRLKDEVAANVDLARRRSRFAAFAVLKSVSLRSAVSRLKKA
jgi:hypothetical protein